MKHIIKLFLLLILFTQSVICGEYGDAFLLASHHSHAQALGYSSVATRVGGGHALNNPAGFASGATAQFGMLYQQFDGLSSNIVLEGNHGISQNYIFGITYIHSAVDGLHYRPNLSGLSPEDRRDSVLTIGADAPGELINYREDGVFLTLARVFEFEINLGWKFFKIPVKMPVGISTKYLDKILVENRGLGFGIDIGSQVFFNLAGMTKVLSNTEFGIGLFVSDILNTPVYWTTEHQDAIKRDFTRGFSMRQNLPAYSTSITLSTSQQNRYPDVRQYGLEIGFKDLVYMRGGYDGYTPSLGLGIGLKKFIIDYSFSQHELANLQKIGINYHF